VPVIDDATRLILGQGLLGAICVVEGIVLAWYVRDNRRLLERLVSKSETDRNVNRQLAQQITDAFVAPAIRRRRPTRAIGDPAAK
jgi:hypothetical protein